MKVLTFGWSNKQCDYPLKTLWPCFHIGLLNVFLTFKSVDAYSNETSFTAKQYFIEYVVLTFVSVDEILWCDHSNETSSVVFSHGTICLVCRTNF